MRVAVTVSSLLLAAGAVAAEPSEVLVERNPVSHFVSCYDSNHGLTNQTSYTYQSSGYCQNHCLQSNAAVFAMTGGSDCLCGNELPPTSAKVPMNKCNTKCNGWPSDMCGGSGTYSVYLTGLEQNVPSISSSTSTTTASGGGTSTTTQEGGGGAGSVSTATNSGSQTLPAAVPSQNGGSSAGSSSQASTQQKSSSSSTAAIAAGVVVGVVGFAALAGAIFFFYRSRQRRANAYAPDVNGYNNSPPMSETQYDGGYMAQRRQSNGSIDDHDFSRRILQVTNPDRF